MAIAEVFEIKPGITAIIGSGGKTTLLRMLGEELAQEHRVVLCTTTKVMPFDGIPNLIDGETDTLLQAFRQHSLVCVGTPLDNGKLDAPAIPLTKLAEMADYVLVEADGSARLPLKAHLPHEPVIPAEAVQTICVTGVSGFGLDICEAAHRSDRFAELAGADVTDAATPENTAQVLQREALADLYFMNQADTPERWEWALRAAQALGRPAVIGSLHKGVFYRC